MFGALIDGEGLNNKSELMKRYLQFFEGSLSVEDFDADNDKPLDFSLKQNYPNPFRQTTIINFSFAEKNYPIALSVYNLLGQEVKKFTVINGNYAVNWDGTAFNGLPLPSGTYIYQLKTADKILSRKMNLVR